MVVYSAICVAGTCVGLYGIFQKSGRKGWLALVPLYNIYVWIKVLERPWWWLLLFLIPYFGFFMLLLMVWKTIWMFNKTRYISLVPGTIFPFLYIPYLGFSSKEKYYKRDELPAMELGFWHSKPINSKKQIKTETKERNIKTKTRGWSDSLIYAIVAAYIIRTFFAELYTIPTSSMEGTLMVSDYLVVSKIAYGPKVPQTPIAIPFVHHTVPKTKFTKSYWDKIQLPFIRLMGLHGVERNDAVVFNYPDGDTVILERQSESYYAIMRNLKQAFQNPNEWASRYYALEGVEMPYWDLLKKYGTNYYAGKEYDVANQEYHVTARPVDKRENYVKRCVAISGDKLEIKNAVLYINDQLAYQPPKMQMSYLVENNGSDISKSNRKKLNINEEDRRQTYYPNLVYYQLSKEQAEKMTTFPNIVAVVPQIHDTTYDDAMFPQDAHFRWNIDNFGPIIIPKAGETVHLNDSTLPLYRRIIEIYEKNTLEIKDGKLFINGKETTTYTFKMNYYWMMGDNRHNSADSRYWGFVPEDHIVGKVSFAWLSLDKYKDWGEKGKIRWNRMFRKVK